MSEPTEAHTIPPQTTMAAGETSEYIYDAATDLGSGQAPENPSVQLLDALSRAEIAGGAAMDDPAIEGTNLFIKVSAIERGRTYELRIAFDHTNPRVPGERSVKIHEIIGL